MMAISIFKSIGVYALALNTMGLMCGHRVYAYMPIYHTIVH